MKNLKILALGALISLSFAPTAYSMNNQETAKKTYEAIADWFSKLNWIDKIRLKAMVDKCKDIEWSKVFEYVKAAK